MPSASQMRLNRYRLIEADYRDGLRIDDICKKHDCHPSDVYRALDRLRAPRRNDKGAGDPPHSPNHDEPENLELRGDAEDTTLSPTGT